jgi:hypothetical protein
VLIARYCEGTAESLARFYRLLYEGKLLSAEYTKIAFEVLGMQQSIMRCPSRFQNLAELGLTYKWEGKTGTFLLLLLLLLLLSFFLFFFFLFLFYFLFFIFLLLFHSLILTDRYIARLYE